MKKIIVAAAVLGASYFSHAQVGIGTPTPVTSTQLDVTATDKGILIPRVALTAIDVFKPIEGAQTESLLVYNSSDASIPTGFYYWVDAKWNRIVGKAELDQVIENLGDNITNIEGDIKNLQAVINYIVPSNPGNEDPTSPTHTTVVYEGGKFYTVTYDVTNNEYTTQEIDFNDLVNGVETKTFMREVKNADGKVKGLIYFSEQTIIDWLAADEANTIDTIPNNAPGAMPIEVTDIVVNNVQEILESPTNITITTVEGDKTFTTVEEYLQYITQFSNGNVIYTEIEDPANAGQTIWAFQYWDEASNTYKIIDIQGLVESAETNTTIVSYNNKQYYLSEAYIKAGGETDPANWTSVPAGAIHVDVVGGVINNIQEILESPTNITITTVEGDKTFTTVEEYLQYVTQYSNGNVIYTEIEDPNDATKTIWAFQYWDEASNTYKIIDIQGLVESAETNTTIVSYNDKQYYLSEAYIKAGGETDPAAWTSVPAGAIHVDVVGGVINNIQEILETPTNITITTAEGDKTFTTVEEYLQYITKFGEGNVIYTEVEDPNDATKTIWEFQYWDGAKYESISIGDLETKTQIKRSEVITDATLPTFGAVRTAPVAADVKKGEIFYEYSAEGNQKDYINMTEDILNSINNNEEIKNAITNVLNLGGNVYFGDHDGDDNKGNAATPHVFYQVITHLDGTKENKEIELPASFLVNLINKYKDIIKQTLGDHITNVGDTVYTGNVYNGYKVYLGKGATTIAAYSAVATPVAFTIVEDLKKINQVLAIKLLDAAGHVVTANTTDVEVVDGVQIKFNIGVGNQYIMLPAGDYEVVVEYTSNEEVTQP
ncbi:hypothetical protein H4K35_02690 [Myroides sp. NP-2]|uniref:hypothetical protein n=1 Tax=Myroides sp. NP-2 TaxID=2759945 RepID=UPI0015F96F62|nr:hypothetical protein [Myroides sp. NP-2]MBB1149044.1 hypothetical protein [Myroides sp. NP-2]